MTTRPVCRLKGISKSHITIIAIGRARGEAETELVDRYLNRMRPKPKLIVLDARKSRNSQDEWHQIREHIPTGSVRLILDERGENITSMGLAHRLGQWRDDGRDLTCIIGGAYGLAEDARLSADLLLAFGKATWPHMLVRAMLVEQLYRTQDILRGGPYHHN